MSLDLMAREIANKGNNVNIITLDSNDNNLYKNREYTVVERYRKKNLPYDIDCIKAIGEIFNKYNEKTDIFHIFNPYLASFAGYQKNKMDVDTPIIGRFNTLWTVCSRGQPLNNKCYKKCDFGKRMAHSPHSTTKKIINIPQYLYMGTKNIKWLNNLDRIFALSPVVKDILIHMGVKSEHISVIPNFADPNLSKASNYCSFSPTNKKYLTILYVGRLIQNKRVDVLIKSVKKCVQEDIKLIIVGDGEKKTELANTAKNMGIEDKVSFEGYVDNKKLTKYYTNADLFVHPHPGPYCFGRTIIESLQHKLPVIVADSGDAKDIIPQAVCTFEKNNPKSLATVIDKLAEDNRKLKELSENAIQAVEKFYPENVVSDIIYEYDDLISSNTN